jgi:glycosyltransferase involved in cell wall biosynthesis
MEGPMRTRIADLGVTGQVHMRAELVSEHERIVHFEMCDVGLFPSTYEPFGIVTLEAMAIGKACVAGARGVVGFREQVVPSGDDQTGLHVDGGNPADIAWGLNEALSDRDRLATWGANGRARVLAEFTWEIAAKKTAEIYRAMAVKNR